MNLEKVSPAFPAVSPVTNDVNSSHDGVGLQNGMNENDNFHNESGGQNDLASGSETPMNIVCSEDNGSCRGSNAEHGQVPWQYRENYPAAYSPECWELISHNPYYVFPPIEPLGGSSNQILRSDWVPKNNWQSIILWRRILTLENLIPRNPSSSFFLFYWCLSETQNLQTFEKTISTHQVSQKYLINLNKSCLLSKPLPIRILIDVRVPIPVSNHHNFFKPIPIRNFPFLNSSPLPKNSIINLHSPTTSYRALKSLTRQNTRAKQSMTQFTSPKPHSVRHLKFLPVSPIQMDNSINDLLSKKNY